ncbi:hypothetical protein [Okeania sp. SIO2C9]|nr:hypothetical protein [Okeania sp. SIO2C9]
MLYEKTRQGRRKKEEGRRKKEEDFSFYIESGYIVYVSGLTHGN